MPLAWLVECKTCCQRFAVGSRELVPGKSTSQLVPHTPAGRFECPHCHDNHEYTTDEYIPGETRTRRRAE